MADIGPYHGDIISIGITKAGEIQIEYYDVTESDTLKNTSFLVLDKEDCFRISQMIKLIEENG